jgi:hypothetical protein
MENPIFTYVLGSDKTRGKPTALQNNDSVMNHFSCKLLNSHSNGSSSERNCSSRWGTGNISSRTVTPAAAATSLYGILFVWFGSIQCFQIGSYYTAQTGLRVDNLKLVILLPQPPKSWDAPICQPLLHSYYREQLIGSLDLYSSWMRRVPWYPCTHIHVT